MYFGAQGFFLKMTLGISSAILSFLISYFGRTQENPLGILLIGPIAGIICLIGILFYAKYNEKEVLDTIAQ